MYDEGICGRTAHPAERKLTPFTVSLFNKFELSIDINEEAGNNCFALISFFVYVGDNNETEILL